MGSPSPEVLEERLKGVVTSTKIMLDTSARAVDEVKDENRGLKVRVDELEKELALFKQKVEGGWQVKVAIIGGAVSVVSAIVAVVGSLLAS